MKRLTLIPSLILLALWTGACSKYYGCDEELDCLPNEPSRGELSVRITRPASADTVMIEIRQGTWKSGRIVHSGPMTEELARFRFPLQHRYTAEAAYADRGDSLRAYDSGRLDLQDRKNCGEVCYRVKELELDLRRADR